MGRRCLALGVFVIWSSFKLKIGTIHDPGSGYVLFYTGILMCLFAATIIVAAVTEGGPTFGSRWEGARWTRPAALIGCLVVYCFALDASPAAIRGASQHGSRPFGWVDHGRSAVHFPAKSRGETSL